MSNTELTVEGERSTRLREQRSTDHRGITTFPADVVAKIAAQAAWEVAYVGGASGGVLGIGAKRNFDRRPQANARIYGNIAVISLDLGLIYPSPLRSATVAVQQHVAARVKELTGLVADQVDVTISWLHRPDREAEGRKLL